MGLDSIISPRDRTLVTGSNGFIGAKVVQILLEYGFTNIRCFVRSSSRLEQLERIINEFADTGRNIDVIKGDLLSREDCREAAREVSLIYHLAAGFDKSFAGAFMNSVITTRNLMDAFLKVGRPKRFVNVSSFAVYSNLKLKRGTLVDELNGRVGIDTFGFFVQVGGSNCLPLTFVDNCADAIVLAGLKPGIDGETFNVVDDELMSSRQFLNAYKKVNRFRSIRLPYSFAYGMCSLWEKYSEWSKGQLPPVFNRRRCAAEWKPMRYSNSKLKQRLGWRPRVPMNQAIEAFVGQFDSKEKVKADTLKC
jgi:nucleoside-diphosphate-sugar epimerase